MARKRSVCKVAVADDYRIARLFFESQIKGNKKYKLAGSFSEADEVVKHCSKHSVDLVIMDILMRKGANGLAAAEQLKKICPNTKIILATSTAESIWIQQAKDIGVESFWYKEYSEEMLMEIVERTMNGEKVYPLDPPNIQFGKIKKFDLTLRDLDVLREMMDGLTNEEIAERLGISVNTVRSHVLHILNKTGFKNRLELAINAASLGIVVSNQPCSRFET